MSNRFHVAPEDLANMVEIARVSSYGPDKKAWTELALYYRGDPARPWVPVVEGRTDALDMSNRFQSAMMGTIERAMSWFEGSSLRDQLSTAVEAAIGNRNPVEFAGNRLWNKMVLRDAAEQEPHHAAEIERRGGRIPIMEPGSRIMSVAEARQEEEAACAAVDQAILDGAVTGIGAAVDRIFKVRTVGITTDSLYEVLRWLYPDSASDSARSLLLERDFGLPARTTRRALAVECGDAVGELGSWVNMFMIAMRFFDRELWMAGQATIANVES